MNLKTVEIDQTSLFIAHMAVLFRRSLFAIFDRFGAVTGGGYYIELYNSTYPLNNGWQSVGQVPAPGQYTTISNVTFTNLPADTFRIILDDVPSMEGLELSSFVSTDKSYYLGDKNAEIKIAVLDLGVKRNILKCMTDRGCYLKVFPMNSTYEEMKVWNPDGFFLSNGPGDPAAMPQVIDQVKKLTVDGKPVFGICLGHQALALSEGISTYKMHNGHRGINHPVKNLATGKAEVTSQNHGFGISEADIKNNKNVEITHINLNDNTIEGIRLLNKNCFSVQYHPESSPGPHDSRYLFDDFIGKIRKQ